MAKRRIMGKSKRPIGLKSSAKPSVMAAPWSPKMNGASTTTQTTTASRIPWGGPRCWWRCLSWNILSLSFVVSWNLVGLWCWEGIWADGVSHLLMRTVLKVLWGRVLLPWRMYYLPSGFWRAQRVYGKPCVCILLFFKTNYIYFTYFNIKSYYFYYLIS